METEAVKQASPLAWIQGMVNENGYPLEFKRHFFLIDPYQDTHPDQVIMKSAQVGWSTLAILKTFHLAKYGGLNCIYTLPTQNVVKDFVFPKVDPLIEKNKEIYEIISKDSVQLKQVGDRFIYYRGSYTEREAITISADIVVNDELDRSDQRVLKTYESRLQASEYGYKWRFSNPSVPGYGVDALYKDSDQMQWHITCHNCAHQAPIAFESEPTHRPHHIDKLAELFVCGECRGEITDADRTYGEWIAKYPERTHRRGYHVSQLMAPWVSAKKIMEQYRDSGPEFFFNFVLGLPYIAAELVVDRETILRATTPSDLPTLSDVVMGVDNGILKHYVIGTPAGVFTYGKTESWEEIERLMRMFNCITVIDANPYPNIPKSLVKKYRGKAFINYYNLNDSKKMEMIKWEQRENWGVIRSDRTKVLDAVAQEIGQSEIKFLMPHERMDEYIAHWGNMYRAIETNSQGISRGVWLTKDNRPDHFAHATVYFRIGLERTRRGMTGGVRPDYARRGAMDLVRGGLPARPGVLINPITKQLDPQVNILKVAQKSGRRR